MGLFCKTLYFVQSNLWIRWGYHAELVQHDEEEGELFLQREVAATHPPQTVSRSASENQGCNKISHTVFPSGSIPLCCGFMNPETI